MDKSKVDPAMSGRKLRGMRRLMGVKVKSGGIETLYGVFTRCSQAQGPKQQQQTRGFDQIDQSAVRLINLIKLAPLPPAASVESMTRFRRPGCRSSDQSRAKRATKAGLKRGECAAASGRRDDEKTKRASRRDYRTTGLREDEITKWIGPEYDVIPG